MASYATQADVTAYIGGDPGPSVVRLLARATELLDAYLVGSAYNVDVNGAPIDAPVILAINQACCAQVEWWIQTGDEFGDLSRITQYSIEGIAVSQAAPPGRLCRRAVDILRVANLMPGVVRAP